MNDDDDIDLNTMLAVGRADHYGTHLKGIAVATLSVMVIGTLIESPNILGFLIVPAGMYLMRRLAIRAAASGEIIEEIKERIKNGEDNY